jgi:branched-chain amino acid transport system permease protein
MMMLGGAGNNVGVLLGVGVFVVARTTIYTYKNMLEAYVPFNVVWLDYLLLSVTIIAILMLRPQGILPEKPIRTIKPLIRQNEST